MHILKLGDYELPAFGLSFVYHEVYSKDTYSFFLLINNSAIYVLFQFFCLLEEGQFAGIPVQRGKVQLGEHLKG